MGDLHPVQTELWNFIYVIGFLVLSGICGICKIDSFIENCLNLTKFYVILHFLTLECRVLELKSSISGGLYILSAGLCRPPPPSVATSQCDTKNSSESSTNLILFKLLDPGYTRAYLNQMTPSRCKRIVFMFLRSNIGQIGLNGRACLNFSPTIF